MAGEKQYAEVAVSQSNTTLARIEEDILALPGPEFEALAEWFSMVLTLRRAVEGHSSLDQQTVASWRGRGDDSPVSEAMCFLGEGGFEPGGSEAEPPAVGSITPDAAEDATGPAMADGQQEVGASAADQSRRRGTKIQNRRYSTPEGAGATSNQEVGGVGTGSGSTREPSHGSQDGEAATPPREEAAAMAWEERRTATPSVESRALLALCGGSRTYEDWDLGKKVLDSLVGEWRDTAGSTYEVTFCSPGDRLSVTIRRPRSKRGSFTRGLIRLASKPNTGGYRITWGLKASYVLMSPDEKGDVVHWASPDSWRKPFEWRRSTW